MQRSLVQGPWQAGSARELRGILTPFFEHVSGFGAGDDRRLKKPLIMEILQSFRSNAISNGKATKSASVKSDITTWCEAGPGRCLFIVEVPDLRHFTDDAKTAISDAAWLAAQVSADKLDLPADAELAVAVRGSLLYDRLITGRRIADFNPDSPDSESSRWRSLSP